MARKRADKAVRAPFEIVGVAACCRRRPSALCFSCGFVALLGLHLACPSSSAADKSGVTPNAISLPSGPGSIEGLGEAFQPTLNTGTAKYGVSLRLSPGTAGHAPSLSLRYEGGGGNGPVGFGWNLPVPYVQRQCDKGIPRYVDADNQLDDDRDGDVDEYDERDVFINEMKEELVPQASGYFFCENEGAFIRYRRRGDFWEGTLPNGTRLGFGETPAARVQDAATGRVFRWLLERSTDTHGNTIVYSYRSFPGDSDRHQKYLAAIRYGPGAPPRQNFHFAVFTYEDRPDWFEDGRPGFILRTGKRLKEIVIGTQGPALAGHLAGDFDGDGTTDHLVRKYQLGYLRYAGTNSHWSLLARVQQVGADGTSTLPPATFGYAVCDPPDLLFATGREIGGANEPPFVMDNELADLVDLNGDGLPDILKTEAGGGAHTGYLNLGEAMINGARAIRWGPPNEVASADGLAWNVNLQSASDVAHLADMDGDGVADLAYKSSIGDVSYFANGAKMSWGQRRAMSIQDFVPPAPFGDPDVRTADLDFDKRMDVVQSIPVGDGVEYRIWFNLGQQRYARSLTVAQTSGFLLSQPGVHLVDFNGDRVPDVVRVRAANVTVTAGLGHGQFAEPVVVPIPDPGLEDAQMAVAKLQDITGDGLADLVLERAEPGQLWYWLNLGNYTFSPRKIIAGMPTGLGLQPTIRWADLNGNGTTDLVYADSQSSPRLVTVDLGELLGCVPGHNVLTNIANGIGRVTTIEYQPSTRFALDDAAAGRRWPDMMPLAVSVVSAVITSDSLGHYYATRFRYHDGYYDGAEKEFRGFARVEQIEIGDSTAPTLVTRSHFDTGREHEALKGVVLRQTAEQEDGKVFWDDATTWTTPPKTLMTGVNEQAVHYAHPTATTRRIIELGQGEERLIESESDYDGFGNQTRQANYGIVVNGDRSAFDDERVITTEFAVNTNAWLVRFPSRSEIADENGKVISRTETFYDDPTFSGPNFGQVLTGDATLTRDWIDPDGLDAFVSSSRTKYDAYGNPILMLDPLAVAASGVADLNQGHAREIEYDGRFHAYPERETIHVGRGSQPLVVEVDYDEGFGKIVRSTDFNGHATTYAFDAFARLVNIVCPGDTETFPTAEYDYILAEPFGQAGLINYVESRLLDKDPSLPGEKRDHYYISRKFTDGLGRSLMLKHEAERDPDTGSPRVIVKDTMTFNARRVVSQTLNPFVSTMAGASLEALLAFEDVRANDWQGGFHQDGELLNLDFNSAHKTSTEYDATLRSVRVTHPDGAFARTAYEALTTINYDENDTQEQSPFFDTPTVYSVDGLGRHIRTDEMVRLNDDGTTASEVKTWTTRAEYDLNDQLTRLTDSQNNVKNMQYDGLRRMTRLDDPNRGKMTYVYDAAANTLETTDAKEQRVTYTYDGVNRLLTEDHHDQGESFSFGHEYDPSQPISRTNRPDVAYFYDTPQADVDQGDGSRATARNTKGMLAFVWDLSGEEHTSYDTRGRIVWTVKRVHDPVHQRLVAYRTRFDYDSTDRLTRVTYPDNDEIGYEYNDRNLFERIRGGPTGFIISNFDYLPSELKRRVQYGNRVETTYSYDQRLRLKSLLTTTAPGPAKGAGAELVHFQYELDPASNLSAIYDQRLGTLVPEGDRRRNTQSFDYDDLHRLIRVQYSFTLPGERLRNDGEINYRYDRIGNMLAQTSTLDHQENGLPIANIGQMDSGGAAGTRNRVGRQATDPPGPHALTSISQPSTQTNSQLRVYSYDANGNMTGIDGLECAWDFKDRLVRAENETLRANYVYDHADRRVIKIVVPKLATEGQPPATPAQEPETRNQDPFSTLYIGQHFEIRDHEQPTKYVWVGNTRIARVIGSLSSNDRVQRLRVYPGWNLVSLAVSSTDTGARLRDVTPPLESAVDRIYRWDSGSDGYEKVENEEDMPAGTVLWLRATRADTLMLNGTYAAPSDLAVATGGGFYPGAGLEVSALGRALSPEATVWSFDPEAQHWHARLAADLNRASKLPEFLEPGQAIFINASAPDVLRSPDPNLRIRYYHQDHLGSASQVSDARGVSIEESSFYPFGGRRSNRKTTDSNEDYGFAQKETDRESGLQFFEARYLASHLGRFVRCDPLSLSAGPDRMGNPQRLHPYSYTGNNPLTRADPLGLDFFNWASDVGEGAWNYAADTAAGTVDFVVENPGKTALAISTFPVWIGPAMIAGVGVTAYGATDDAIQAASGEDFDSDGYRGLSDKERRMKLGSALVQTLEVTTEITGAKALVKPKPPKKNFGPDADAKTHYDGPTAHGKTHIDSPAAHGRTRVDTEVAVVAKQQWKEQNFKKLQWILQAMEQVREARKGAPDHGGPLQDMLEMREVFRAAEKKFGPTKLPGDYGTYFPGTTPVE